MSDSGPRPYGIPAGPELNRGELLGAYLAGATAGISADLHIEGDLLVARALNPLAVRLDAAVLVRSDVPHDVAALRAALEQALSAAGLSLVEEDPVLAGVVGIEVAGLRGAAWDLWARDTEAGLDALKHRALGDLADGIDPHAARQRAEVDAALEALERDLGDGGD